ncbi:hypothetical protein C4J81_06615 [Deltaproteobacteria bacterium Smac51]|nr:hypothetical protein C4J81_06615 [Deltaproteobacteria bacterium Smac51]
MTPEAILNPTALLQTAISHEVPISAETGHLLIIADRSQWKSSEAFDTKKAQGESAANHVGWPLFRFSYNQPPSAQKSPNQPQPADIGRIEAMRAIGSLWLDEAFASLRFEGRICGVPVPRHPARLLRRVAYSLKLNAGPISARRWKG